MCDFVPCVCVWYGELGGDAGLWHRIRESMLILAKFATDFSTCQASSEVVSEGCWGGGLHGNRAGTGRQEISLEEDTPSCLPWYLGKGVLASGRGGIPGSRGRMKGKKGRRVNADRWQPLRSR